MRTSRAFFLMISVILAVAAAPAQTAHHHKSKKPVKQFVLPPMPPGPLQQVPLEKLPAVPPRVSYENGKLTIVAENSTLGDILREVHKCTGATIDVPGNPAERVAAVVGPGPARDVLATLLNGTSFNYVMVGSPTNSAELSSIALTSKPNGSVTETAHNQGNPIYTPPETVSNFGPGTGRPGMVPPGFVPPGGQPGVQPPQPVNTADAGDDSDNSDDDSADDNGDQDQPGGMQADQNAQPGQAPNAGPRTPQQILQMMQRNQQVNGGQPVPPQPAPNPEEQ